MSSVAFAGDVSSRADDHGKMVRVVFEWPDGKMPPVHVRPVDDRTVEVTFDGPEKFNAFKPIAAIPEIVDIRDVTGADGHLKLWVMQAGPLYKKDVQVGNRVLIDFAQSPTMRAKAAAEKKAAEVAAVVTPPVVKPPEPAKQIPIKATAPVVKPPATTIAAAKTNMPAVAPVVVAAVPLVETPPKTATPDFTVDAVSPPVVTLSSTSNFGMAAFLDGGHLWIAIDNPNVGKAPQITGKDAAKFAAFKRIDTDEASIFYVPVPPSIKAVHVEGGGLHWRVVLAPPTSNKDQVNPERVEENKERRIFWPLHATKIIPFENPISGEPQTIITVKQGNQYTGPAREFVEFHTLAAYAGLVVVADVDDLKIDTKNDGIMVSRPHGLSVTSELDANTATPVLLPPPTPEETEKETTQQIAVKSVSPSNPVPETSSFLYRFDRWAMGGAESLRDNESALIADLVEKSDGKTAGGLMDIGKMYLANAHGAEALGYFRLAAENEPALLDTPDYLGLRGAAYVMNGQYDLGYEDLRLPALDSYPDVGAWRAYTLANLQDWPQALEKTPDTVDFIRTYPPAIGSSMMLTFAEIALRGGKIADAQRLLAALAPAAGKDDEADTSDVQMHIQAQRDYLLGEAARQLGQKDNARTVWDKLLTSQDDKYRTRARLALTVMNYEDGKVAPELAIDNLEGLRYVWRGDDVETAVNSRLGNMYLEHGDYLRGLNVLKDAASNSPDSEAGRRITADMAEAFRSLFIGDRAAKVDPLDAITVYEKFTELVPPGDDGVKLTLSLVDRLVAVDLLDRAALVLNDLIDHRLAGAEKVKASLRLAGIDLINKKPKDAMSVLNKVDGMLAGIGDADQLNAFKHEMNILRARGMFQMGQVDQSLALLGDMGNSADVLRARADVAWQTARWGDAATALSSLLTLDPPVSNKPPTAAQAEIIRNLAVATNLSGDRGALNNLRTTYMDLMLQTTMAKEFDVITRERQVSTLADRDTLTKVVAETDIFGGFLDMYKKSEKTPEQPAPVLDANATAPVPNAGSGT